MLDRYTLKLIKPPLKSIAGLLVKRNITADQLTLGGFFVGLLSVPAIALHWYWLGFLFIAMNRIMDGLDGEVARLTRASDRGAYLDIVLDFIFYAAVVFAFALANPENNALAAAALLFAFMGTGSSFLAFAIMAERRQIKSITYPNKGFFYLTGLAEGTETVIALLAMCLWPNSFNLIAWLFFVVCVITTFTRVSGASHTLKQQS